MLDLGDVPYSLHVQPGRAYVVELLHDSSNGTRFSFDGDGNLIRVKHFYAD